MEASANRLAPLPASESTVLNKTDYFSTISLWPLNSHIDTRGWLSNFSGNDRKLAASLLNSFVYLSDRVTRALMVGAFHNLSNILNKNEHSSQNALERWASFRNRMVITYVEGEEPNPTDSGGTLFTRYARQELRVPQAQIMHPERAMRVRAAGSRPIVFVDDFVGSGDQMVKTWHRKYQAAIGAEISFADICNADSQEVIYIPIIATTTGIDNIRKNCEGLNIYPAHELEKRESPIHPESLAWPDGQREEGIEFIKRVTQNLGDSVKEPLGYHELGLAIAFEHSVPDATLPIFYHESDSWRPLIRRL